MAESLFAGKHVFQLNHEFFQLFHILVLLFVLIRRMGGINILKKIRPCYRPYKKVELPLTTCVFCRLRIHGH